MKDGNNKIDYLEWHASDLTATRAFFEQLLGWKFTDYGPDYTSFEDGRVSGGFFRSHKFSAQSEGSVLVVLYTEELERTRERVLELGGSITKDVFSFPGGRRFHFMEPSGNELAVWSE